VDDAKRYLELSLRGREAFLQGAAPAALYRRRDPSAPEASDDVEDVPTHIGSNAATPAPVVGDHEIYPLRAGAGSDVVTLGRTAGNDIVVPDVTVSRRHATFRERDGRWVVQDAGSKNGTRVDGSRLEPEIEQPLRAGARVRVGDVETRFYPAPDLFELLQRGGER
jgi:hypothetical protein